MNDKYEIDTEENRMFLKKGAQALLDFGRRFPSPGGGSYYLGDDGTPWKDRNRETCVTVPGTVTSKIQKEAQDVRGRTVFHSM